MRPAFVLAAMPLVATAKLLRDVTKPEFQDFLKQNKLVLTAFSSPDYEPVQPFVKIFEHVAHTMQTPSILINCDKEKELCKDYDINSYPAIRMLSRSDDPDDPQSHIMRYRGKRTEQALKSFVLKQELPAVTHIRPQDYQHFQEIDDVVVIAYIHPDPKDQKALLSVFEAVAAKHRHEFVFGYVDDLGITSAETVNLPSVTCWRNTDGDDKVFNGPFTEADLDALLVSAKTGVIGEFSERNVHLYMAKDKLTVYIFALNPTATSTELLHELTPLAKKYAKYVTFGLADATEFAPMAQNFGLEIEMGFPALVVHAPVNDNVFIYRQGRAIEEGVVEDMLTTILHGKAKPGQVFGNEAGIPRDEL